MALDRQINLYSVDTGDFYSNHEKRLHWRNATLRAERNYVVNGLKVIEKSLYEAGYSKKDMSCFASDKFEKVNIVPETDDLVSEYCRLVKLKQHKNKLADETKNKLLKLLANKMAHNEETNGKDHIRELKETSLADNKVISLFESSLTRTIGVEKDELTRELIVLQVYYFDVFKDISYYGFTLNGEKYKYLTSSAGQIRKKKAVFIKQSTWDKYEKTIMCGLTIDKINAKGGNNVNKHLAYMALANSATDKWDDFDIDKCIVIKDFETNVEGKFDLIDDKDYSITETIGEVPIPHTDGAGMVLYGKNRMVRLPWVKGLLGVFDFRRFILEMREKYNDNTIGVIDDIYGKSHDVIAENIEIIFTESQFKMYKYYDSWDEYKEYFKKYNCTAGTCNQEEERIKNSRLNYQEDQTLIGMTREELEKIAEKSVKNLTELCSSIGSMQRAFGVTPYNMNPTPLQRAIKIYPNLMNDEYLKITLRDIKNSLIKKYRAGKLEIEGKYTFLLPDFYAACEYWFLHIDNPNGLLNDKEVYCNLFKNRDKLDCLRSPHLYKEHAIRYNTASKSYEERHEILKKWFDTSAVYTSCKDLISKILQFDVDGDHSLVIGEPEYVKVAERVMNGVLPLYYNMQKAKPSELNNKTIYEGLNKAFTGSNIGIYSNNISKIWNSDIFVNGTQEERKQATDVVKLLCMENNFVIDYAKTLYKPERPKDIDKLITSFTKKKLPHFFIYAKDKKVEQVEENNGSLVNQLEEIIPDVRINTRGAGLGKIDYRLLMHNPDIQINKRVIEKYEEINTIWRFKINMKDPYQNNMTYVCNDIKSNFVDFGYDESEIADMLIKYLYKNNNPRKDTLWFCYGDYIASNLQDNVETQKTKFIQCIDCGEWFETNIKNNNTCRCDNCLYIHKKELKRLEMQRYRSKRLL